MNNLHRELAPISDAAWAQIEQEATRTLKRYLAARRVVDVPDPKGGYARGRGHGPHQADRCAERWRPGRAACGVRPMP